MSEPESIVEGCLRVPIRYEVEDAKTLDRARRSVNPRIVFAGAIVGGMPYPDSQDPLGAGGSAAGPAVEPDITHVRGVIPRRDIGVGRRKYGQAAAIELSGDRAVANLGRPPVRSAGHRG